MTFVCAHVRRLRQDARWYFIPTRHGPAFVRVDNNVDNSNVENRWWATDNWPIQSSRVHEYGNVDTVSINMNWIDTPILTSRPSDGNLRADSSHTTDAIEWFPGRRSIRKTGGIVFLFFCSFVRHQSPPDGFEIFILLFLFTRPRVCRRRTLTTLIRRRRALTADGN